MRIGLASYEFRNKDVAFNLSQIEKGMREASGSAELLCFGEAFLQGFDALSWHYDEDRSMAITQSSEIMQEICALSQRYGIDLIFGYIERDRDSIYSSCAVVEEGHLAHNYRRISRGWKKYWETDGHYREGNDTAAFLYKDRSVTLALCGDLWDYPERFRTDGLLIWPVYVNLSLSEWKQGEEAAYAEQALLAARETLMVDSFCRKSEPSGTAGTFFFRDGRICAQAEYGKESILFVDVE